MGRMILIVVFLGDYMGGGGWFRGDYLVPPGLHFSRGRLLLFMLVSSTESSRTADNYRDVWLVGMTSLVSSILHRGSLRFSSIYILS